MTLNKKTRAELKGMIFEKDACLERKLLTIENLEKQKIKDINYRNELQMKIRELEQVIEVNKLSDVADLKSFLVLIEPFKSDLMTHHEKRYLATKIMGTIKRRISDKLEDIKIKSNDRLLF